MWYWYGSRDDELMLDLDDRLHGTVARAAGAESRRAYFGPTRVRLEAAIKSGALKVKQSVYIYPSAGEFHYHVIIPLVEPMVHVARFVWEMQLRSDLYRGRCNIMRALMGVPFPGLLIAPEPWEQFRRGPDAVCRCETKHDFETFRRCPAAYKLRGEESRSESYFGALRPNRKAPGLSWTRGPQRISDFAVTVDTGEDDGVVFTHATRRTEGG